MSLKLADSMHWQIYQAYLLGPHALFRLFEEAFGKAALYGPPDPDQQQRTIDDLAGHMTRLKAQIEKLQEEASQLHYCNFQPGRRNAELEAQLTTDWHNSSRPPSTDPPWAKRTKSLRRPSGRLAGGQGRSSRRDAAACGTPQPGHRASAARVPTLPLCAFRESGRASVPAAGLGGRAGEVESDRIPARAATLRKVRADNARGVSRKSPLGRAVWTRSEGPSALLAAISTAAIPAHLRGHA
jgi:Family of unknown function (DUF6444)